MAEQLTLDSLKKSLKAKNLMPVYLLHGEEGYFVDEASKLFEELLPEELRDFNLYTFYAPQVDADAVIDACQRYPMMADFQVVIVKEAHQVKSNWLSKLQPYLANPTPTTVLVIVYRGADMSVDSKTVYKDFSAASAKTGILTAKKLKPAGVQAKIKEVVEAQGLTIEPKAQAMLEQYVGSDISRIFNEITKMAVAMPKGSQITPESIERNIGISKDFNNFEFRSAIANRNAQLSFQIADYFSRDPKKHPVQTIFPVLFSLFSDLLIAFYSPDKSERGLMATFKVKWPIQVADVMAGMRRYTAWQVIEIIDAIRRADAMSKGIGSRQDGHEILRQLIFRILSARGQSPV